MSQININGLCFCYDGSSDNIFENVSFSIDTNWKVGLIGRNGKGKTTFLNLQRNCQAAIELTVRLMTQLVLLFRRK